MSLHDDLLEQAEHLAGRDAGRPKQASLRRAVSTAYYALFHLLIREATAALVSDPRLRQLVPRAFVHKDMKDACQQFVGNLPAHLIGAIAVPPVPDDLRIVAQAFMDLQQARHEADYNVAQTFNRPDTRDHLDTVRKAFEAWERVRGQQAATVFLANLLLGSKWKR